MRTFTLLFLLLLTVSATYGQLGITGQYLNVSAQDELMFTDINGQQLSDPAYAGWEASLDYMLGLKDTRIYLVPSFSYAAYNGNFSANQQLPELSSQLLQVGLHLQLYPFDLQGDCKCPTFDKSGEFFNKGFFFRVGGTYVREQFMLSRFPAEGLEFDGNGWQLGGGIGLDVGVNHFLTVTPLVEVRYAAKRDLTLDDDMLEGVWESSSAIHFLPGIRLGWHLRR